MVFYGNEDLVVMHSNLTMALLCACDDISDRQFLASSKIIQLNTKQCKQRFELIPAKQV